MCQCIDKLFRVLCHKDISTEYDSPGSPGNAVIRLLEHGEIGIKLLRTYGKHGNWCIVHHLLKIVTRIETLDKVSPELGHDPRHPLHLDMYLLGSLLLVFNHVTLTYERYTKPFRLPNNFTED